MRPQKPFVIIAIIILGISAVWIYQSSRKGDLEKAYNQPRLVRYAFTVTNTTNQLIKSAELKVRAPVLRTPSQKCGEITASQTFETLKDKVGNQVLRFTLADLPPFGSRIITVSVDLMMAQAPVRTDLDERSVWLAAEPFVEADDTEIKAEAQKLTAGDPQAVAAKINAWTADHITYAGYVANERGARYAFKNRKGDCTEYMDLFVALSRAASIPARGLGGFICPESANLTPAGYHNWAEFYDGKTWQPADPQNRMFMTKARDYVVMRIISPALEDPAMGFDRFEVKGEGLKVSMD